MGKRPHAKIKARGFWAFHFTQGRGLFRAMEGVEGQNPKMG